MRRLGPRRRQRIWVRDPHSGGIKIPLAVRLRTEQRIRAYAERHYAKKFIRLGIRFRGALCYIDAYTEPESPSRGQLRAWGETRQQYLRRLRDVPLHLVRLRYFGNEEAWSLAFYTYSNERYEACTFPNSTFYETPEEGCRLLAGTLRPVAALTSQTICRPNSTLHGTEGWRGSPSGR